MFGEETYQESEEVEEAEVTPTLAGAGQLALAGKEWKMTEDEARLKMKDTVAALLVVVEAYPGDFLRTLEAALNMVMADRAFRKLLKP